MAVTVKLGGVNIGGDNAYSWPLSTGVFPHEAKFTVTERVADDLRDKVMFGGQAAPSSGTIDPSTADDPNEVPPQFPHGISYEVNRDGPGGNLQVDHLYLVDIFPGPTTHTRRIRVVDRRWMWQHLYIASTFNERRVTSEITTQDEGQAPTLRVVTPNVIYNEFTLKNGDRWLASDVLKKVLRRVAGYDVDVSDKIAKRFDQQPVDDLFLDDPAHFAVERVLAYLPGASVYINREGKAVVVDTLDGSEDAVYQANKDKQQMQVGTRVADRRNARPRKIIVLVTPEIDVRFNYTEPSGSGTAVVTEDTNELVNVARMTDLDGLAYNGEVIGPGTMTPLSDLFSAYGNGPGHGDGNRRTRPLDWDILRKHRASAFRLAELEFSIVNRSTQVADPIWARRIAAIGQAYRQFFKLDDLFAQRFASIRPVRSGIVSAVHGARAKSPVYSDFVRRPGYHGLSRHGTSPLQGMTVRGHADKLVDCTAAPFNVKVLKPSSQGVLQLVPERGDPEGYYTASILGHPEEVQGIPLGLLGIANAQIAGALYNVCWEHVQLEAGWKMSTVLSCIPASPNSIARFHREEITPAMASDVIGRDVGECTGPVSYVRVFPAVATARFAWTDEAGEVTLGYIKGENPDLPLKNMTNPTHVLDVAKAAAARVYSGLLDRPFGTMQVDMDPELVPTGAINKVQHLMQGGATVSKVSFSTVATPLDIWRFLPASTRRSLMRSLQTVDDPLSQSLGNG